MHFYNKYKKYTNKIKYFQKGGSTTFYIFTTGLCSWGQFTPFKYFTEFLLEQIINKIPERYTKIVINNYDPFRLPEDDDSTKFKEHLELCENLFFVKCNELSTLSRTIQYTNLHRDYFRDEATIRDVIGGQVDAAAAAAGGVVVDVTDISKHYIIIDAAHLYKYIDVNTVCNGPVYGLPQDGNHKLNSIYLSLFGTEIYPQPSVVGMEYTLYNSAYINYADFFKVLDDGRIVTYIDMMYKNKYNMIENTYYNFKYDPLQKIQTLYEIIIRTLRINEKYKSFNVDVFITNKENVKSVIIDIINYIMDGLTEELLISTLANNIAIAYS
jgi:hypothetical protein